MQYEFIAVFEMYLAGLGKYFLDGVDGAGGVLVVGNKFVAKADIVARGLQLSLGERLEYDKAFFDARFDIYVRQKHISAAHSITNTLSVP